MRLFVPLLLLPLAFAGCGGEPKQPQQPAAPSETTKSVKPLVPKVEIHDWCKEHGVPESICTRCNESLSPGFKEMGDWCDEHDLPDSQCFECHPELEAEFRAKAPEGAVGK